MIAPTHIIGGQLSYFIVSWWAGHPPHIVETLVAGFAALLPDLDHKKSFISRLIPLSEEGHDLLGKHRTFTHSVIAIALVWLITRFLPDGLALAVLSGYVSHILLDLMTKSGVKLFWPSQSRAAFPGNIEFRIEVMGRGELKYAAFLVMLCVPALWAAEHNAGFLGTMRDAIGDIQAARNHFDSHRREAEWWLTVRGMTSQGFEPIDGHYKIISHYRANGLILKTPEGPRSVCGSYDCDWSVDRAVIKRGLPAQTSAQYLRTRAISAEMLRELLEPYEQIGEVYLAGELQLAGVAGESPTIIVNDDQVTLNFAEPNQIWHWSGRITQVSLMIHIRHQPGVRVPRLEVPPALEEPPDPTIGIHPLMLPYFPK